MPTLNDVSDFLQLAKKKAVLDVRSPGEYAAGHIPGAKNLPLFDNGERKAVGTLYKQVGRDQAIRKGLEVVGPKLVALCDQALEYAPGREVLLYCWRGGLRSKNMAWLLELAGFHVVLLQGGYKAYRRYIRRQLGMPGKLVVLGGKTGSGKTEILQHIGKHNFQVLDLEALAHHKGSAFGDLGQLPQPTNEQFENSLHKALSKLDPGRSIWVEDESRGIGKISIPEPFFLRMRTTDVVFLDVPKSDRVNRLVREYANFNRERLAAAIVRITKKLGGLNAKRALEALENGDFQTAADILLLYYDKAYLKGLSMRDQEHVFEVPVSGDDPEKNAASAIRFYQDHLAQQEEKNQQPRI